MNEYIYDGTFEGFLTAVFYAYQYTGLAEIVSLDSYVPSFATTPVHIKTEDDKFDRVYKSIEEKLGHETLESVFFLYLSCERDSDTTALKYLKLCYRYGNRANLAEQNPVISKVIKYRRRVTLEAHNFNGFIRFKRVAEMTFYSAIEPDNNILPLIIGHFKSRFQDQNFIIHDMKREAAIVYRKDTGDAAIMELSKEKGLLISEAFEADDNFEKLWKEFYKATTIEERINPKLQRQHMPKRYWKHILEVKDKE